MERSVNAGRRCDSGWSESLLRRSRNLSPETLNVFSVLLRLNLLFQADNSAYLASQPLGIYDRLKPIGSGPLMALIELKGIVEDWEKFPAAGAASVRLSAAPSTEWSKFFCQALALAAAEGGIPPDFGETASVTGDRIVIPGASREAVIRYLGALSHIVEETNRITAGYHGLLRRNHEAQ